jgi:hypothetical protein
MGPAHTQTKEFYMSILKVFANPSPLELAVSHLKDSELNRLEAMKQAEYFIAMEKMYRERSTRLKQDIQELTDDAASSSKAAFETGKLLSEFAPRLSNVMSRQKLIQKDPA